MMTIDAGEQTTSAVRSTFARWQPIRIHATPGLCQHVEGNPTPPRQLALEMPAAVETGMLKAMWVDPARRCQSMEDLHKSILALSKQDVRA